MSGQNKNDKIKGLAVLIVLSLAFWVGCNTCGDEEKKKLATKTQTAGKYDALGIAKYTFENLLNLKVSKMPDSEGIPIWQDEDSAYKIESVFYVRNQYSKMDKYFYSANIRMDKSGKGNCTFDYISKDTTLIYP